MRHAPNNRSWIDALAPGKAKRRPNADGRSFSQQVVDFLAQPGNSPMSPAGIHIGAKLAAPTWSPHHTGRLLASLAARGKIERVRGGLYRGVAS